MNPPMRADRTDFGRFGLEKSFDVASESTEATDGPETPRQITRKTCRTEPDQPPKFNLKNCCI